MEVIKIYVYKTKANKLTCYTDDLPEDQEHQYGLELFDVIEKEYYLWK